MDAEEKEDKNRKNRLSKLRFLQKKSGHKKSKSVNSRPWVTTRGKKIKRKQMNPSKTYSKNVSSVENQTLQHTSDRFFQIDKWKRNFSEREKMSKINIESSL